MFFCALLVDLGEHFVSCRMTGCYGKVPNYIIEFTAVFAFLDCKSTDSAYTISMDPVVAAAAAFKPPFSGPWCKPALSFLRL